MKKIGEENFLKRMECHLALHFVVWNDICRTCCVFSHDISVVWDKKYVNKRGVTWKYIDLRVDFREITRYNECCTENYLNPGGFYGKYKGKWKCRYASV